MVIGKQAGRPAGRQAARAGRTISMNAAMSFLDSGLDILLPCRSVTSLQVLATRLGANSESEYRLVSLQQETPGQPFKRPPPGAAILRLGGLEGTRDITLPSPQQLRVGASGCGRGRMTVRCRGLVLFHFR